MTWTGVGVWKGLEELRLGHLPTSHQVIPKGGKQLEGNKAAGWDSNAKIPSDQLRQS